MKRINEYEMILRARLKPTDLRRLAAIRIRGVREFIADAIELCDPAEVVVLDDSRASRTLSRRRAIETGEEKPLRIEGHTVHFDSPEDQGRDREVTRYLVPRGDHLSPALNQIERGAGLMEVRALLRGAMRGRTMIVRFLSLGPTGSVFSIPCVECTDSWYVSHCLDLLYRPGYRQFKTARPDTEFFATLHSAGRLNERMVSVDTDKRRIYIDYTRNTVYSVNTQYAGNTVGLKKLALRLTIRKADREGWLAEHMFLAAIHGPRGRKTYFAGAFPSACGKTSTAMLPGEKILGDDIAYFRAIRGTCRAVNAESGIFGIIQNVNAKDDPAIWEVLTKPGEVIFSNVLVNDGKPYWLGMGEPIPEEGENFIGQWQKGMKDAQGQEIPPAHKNARYAVELKALPNCDRALNDRRGVKLNAILYGGRDAKAYVPCQQSFDWDHGIVAYGAALETETTFAVLGQEGVPEINLMSIQDFVSIPLGQYIRNNLAFGHKLRRPPLIFGVNYFLRDLETHQFLNGIRDKHVWLKWMELRVHGELDAIRTPTGWIPKYEDLVPLFHKLVRTEEGHPKVYQWEEYVKQFTIRIPENLAKLDRVEDFHRKHVEKASATVFRVFREQRQRLLAARKRFGDYIPPDAFAKG
ncbi:MAG: phosphoenolpyruvate carboxykinase (GTP) [Kiritimatiellia bacterium]